MQNTLVKASGGVAVAVLLYLTNPAARAAVEGATPEKKAAIQAVDSLVAAAAPAATPAPGQQAPATPGAVVDSISRTLGYRNYAQLRVLAKPQDARVLQSRTAAVLARP